MSVEINSNKGNESEREEGEIVELSDFGNNLNCSNVFDDISSEEEFELRERIAELEARNLELEKIASISNTKYDLKCSRDQPNLDILKKGSLVSYGKNNAKVLGSTTAHRRRRRRSRRKTTSQSKRERRKRSSSSDLRAERDSSRRTKKRKRSRYSSTSEDSDGFHVYSRKELEAALFRGEQHKKLNPVVISDDEDKILELRLQALQSTNDIKTVTKSETTSGDGGGDEEDYKNVSNNNTLNLEGLIEEDEEQKALEEQELRLIALKSAYIKKFEVRKKKKLMMETRPYSPTDDVIQIPVEIPVVNLVGSTDYSDNNMDISPITSPPPREPEESYYRPVDMDLAFSGNSNSPISYVQHLFADDLLFKDNLTDEAISESKVEEIIEPPEPPAIVVVPQTLMSPPSPPKLQTQKSEDISADISLEADCLRSLLLSNLNKNRSRRAKENASPPKTNNPPMKKKDEPPIVVPMKPPSPIVVIPIPNDCDSPKESPKLTEISNNIIQYKPLSNSNSPNPNIIENVIPKSLLTAPIVNKLIIQLGQSSSSSSDSDDDDGTSSSGANSSHESDSDSNTNKNRGASNEKENTNNNNFQEKLDQYLKTVRSKLNETKKDAGKIALLNKKTVNSSSIKVNTNSGGVASTPVAVRHLPLSSQLEYKRLISRMKLLEKQKTDRVTTNGDGTLPQKINVAVNKSKDTTVAAAALPPTSKIVSLVAPKPVKAILKKKIVNNSTGTKVNSVIGNSHSSKPVIIDEYEKLVKSLAGMNDDEKLVILNNLETKYSNQSAIFLGDIDTLVKLIKHAQTEKIKQVKVEQNILELRKKLELMEAELSGHKTTLKKMYPKIFTSHKKIIEDRKKCRSSDEFCMKIGKLVKGEEYKNPSDQKTMFIDKIKKLSDAHKKLKDINIKTIEEIEKSNEMDVEEVPKDNNKKTNYISPLEYMKPTTENILNPNGVLCPFELTGQCEDSQCQYEHLINAAKAATNNATAAAIAIK